MLSLDISELNFAKKQRGKKPAQHQNLIPEKLTRRHEMMQEIGNLKFKRAIVPEDAVNLDINTIDAADASSKVACVAICARFLRKNGTYSCQLVFSRSKLVPNGLSQPRAELFAATMNTRTGEVVKRAFQSNHKKKIKLTDSHVTLHSICNPDKQLKQWVSIKIK